MPRGFDHATLGGVDRPPSYAAPVHPFALAPSFCDKEGLYFIPGGKTCRPETESDE